MSWLPFSFRFYENRCTQIERYERELLYEGYCISLLSALFCCVTLIAFRSNILRHFLNRIVYSSISIVPSSVHLQCRHVPPSVHYLIPPQPPSVHYLIPPQPPVYIILSPHSPQCTLSYPPTAPQCTLSLSYPPQPPVYSI